MANASSKKISPDKGNIIKDMKIHLENPDRVKPLQTSEPKFMQGARILDNQISISDLRTIVEEGNKLYFKKKMDEIEKRTIANFNRVFDETFGELIVLCKELKTENEQLRFFVQDLVSQNRSLQENKEKMNEEFLKTIQQIEQESVDHIKSELAKFQHEKEAPDEWIQVSSSSKKKRTLSQAMLMNQLFSPTKHSKIHRMEIWCRSLTFPTPNVFLKGKTFMNQANQNGGQMEGY